MFFEDSIERVTLDWICDNKTNSVIFSQDNLPTKYIITFLTNNLIRIRVWPQGEPVTTHTWAIVDEETNDVPYEGRLRHGIPITNNNNNTNNFFKLICYCYISFIQDKKRSYHTF